MTTLTPFRVAAVTGSRAEFGLLSRLLRHLDDDPDVALSLIVTGSHLSQEHGATLSEIVTEGFAPSATIPLDSGDQSASAIVHAMGTAHGLFFDAFAQQKPHLLILLGDRYEIVPAAIAATFLSIPIAHIGGGETTLGALDNIFRALVTDMSRIHFVADKEYQENVKKRALDGSHVFNVGHLGIENSCVHIPENATKILAELGLSPQQRLFAVTYHPVTSYPAETESSIDALLSVLGQFADSNIVFTGVNADPGGLQVSAKIRRFVAQNKTTAAEVQSLGFRRYLSLVAAADVVVGNSSSGMTEAPALGTPTVNIGSRQEGRIRTPTIIDCSGGIDDISNALHKALSLKRNAETDSLSRYSEATLPSRVIVEHIKAFLETEYP